MVLFPLPINCYARCNSQKKCFWAYAYWSFSIIVINRLTLWYVSAQNLSVSLWIVVSNRIMAIQQLSIVPVRYLDSSHLSSFDGPSLIRKKKLWVNYISQVLCRKLKETINGDSFIKTIHRFWTRSGTAHIPGLHSSQHKVSKGWKITCFPVPLSIYLPWIQSRRL